MKTQQHTAVAGAIYEPSQRKISFHSATGKMLFGFIGELAGVNYIKALQSNIPTQIKETEDMDKKHNKIKQLHAILAKKGLFGLKEDIVSSYGVESCKELTIEQLDEIILHLNESNTNDRLRKSRSTMLSLLDKLGVKGNSEIGWDHVNGFLSDPRIAGKVLYHMSPEEISATCAKLRAIIHKQKNK